MFLLVVYPAAWHIDTFSDGQPSIEFFYSKLIAIIGITA